MVFAKPKQEPKTAFICQTEIRTKVKYCKTDTRMYSIRSAWPSGLVVSVLNLQIFDSSRNSWLFYSQKTDP